MKEWKYIHKEVTTSTNDEAIAYSHQTQDRQFVITASQQTQGRGRRGRSWIGQQGNLFVSLGLKYPISQCGDLAFFTSLAIAQSILRFSAQEDVKIKWPNDVLVRGNKISGILIEKGAGDYMIIGIGVNIATSPEIHNSSYRATSLRDVGISTTCQIFLEILLDEFTQLFQENLRNGFAPIREQWLKLAFGIGKEIIIMQEQTEKRGIFIGVDEHGLLLLERNGNVEKISAGDVFILKEKENNCK